MRGDSLFDTVALAIGYLIIGAASAWLAIVVIAFLVRLLR